MKITAYIFCLLIPTFTFSQGKDKLSLENYEFESDKIAKEAVSKIVQYTGLIPNFNIVPNRDIPTAVAYLKNDKRYIAYNPKFIEEIDIEANTNWASVSVLAHEIGHHLAGHTLTKNQTLENELLADQFSGFILYQMGASLTEAQAALSTVGHEMDTTKHPVKQIRINALSQGWENAKNLKNTDAYSSKNQSQHKDTVQFIYKCQFIKDPNVYLVDEKDNIIRYNNYGKPIIVGTKEASTTSKYLWIYNSFDNSYGVDASGKIWQETTYGSILIVGKVKKIDKEK